MVASPFIFILNKILKHNEGSLKKLQPFFNKTFSINILGIHVSGMIDKDGFINSIPQNQLEYDTEILVPLSSTKYLIEQDTIGFFQQINIIGNKKLARNLLETFSNLHLTAIYTSKSPIINLLINKLGSFSALIMDLIKLAATNATNTISEYLLYQTEDLVTTHEANQFYNAVDELKGQIDILQKRIDLLTR